MANGASVNIIKSYERIDVEIAQSFANTYFGDGTFRSRRTLNQNIVDFENLLGYINPPVYANEGKLTDQGKDAYMKCLYSNYLAHHLFQSLDENGKRYLRNHNFLYKWSDLATGETYRD